MTNSEFIENFEVVLSFITSVFNFLALISSLLFLTTDGVRALASRRDEILHRCSYFTAWMVVLQFVVLFVGAGLLFLVAWFSGCVAVG
ncbi:hypothetical protein ABSE38_004790 [Escherichia coli]|nr:hypothetical protein [Escherichia coli]EJL3766048.1 hypothetical protein [Escherichia coli]